MSLSSVSRVMPLRLLPDPRPAGSYFMWIASAQLPDIPPLCASFMADAVTRTAPAYCSLLVSLMLTHAPSSPRCGCTMRTRSMRRAIHGGKEEVRIHYTHS